MIRIMHFCSDSDIGGAIISLYRLLGAASDPMLEHVVVVPACCKMKNAFNDLNVELVTYDSTSDESFSLPLIFEMKKLISRFSPHIVHTHGMISARIAAKLSGVRSLIYTRHTYSENRYGTVKRMLNSLCTTKAVAVNPTLISQLSDSGINTKDISLIYNGCDTISSIDLKECNVGHEIRLLYLGRIVKGKGLDTAVEALKRLNKEFYRVTLTIAGEGEYKDSLISLADSLGVGNYVRFMPFTYNIAGLIAECDIAINTSYVNEASSNFVIEALSASKPVLISDIAGNAYMIEQGVEGIKYRSGDIDSFCCGVKSITKDSKTYHSFCNKAKERHSCLFSLESMSSRYIQLWKDEYSKYYEKN